MCGCRWKIYVGGWKRNGGWFIEYDGLPIKNKLPEELRERLKTRKKWMEEGYLVKEDAEGYEMHASVPAKKTFMYFLDDDVAKMTPDNMLLHQGIAFNSNRLEGIYFAVV